MNANAPTDFRERFRNYELNRADFPREELLPFLGQWVAFSLDGKRIIAGAEQLAELEGALRAGNVDPQEVFFEKVTDDADAVVIDSE